MLSNFAFKFIGYFFSKSLEKINSILTILKLTGDKSKNYDAIKLSETV